MKLLIRSNGKQARSRGFSTEIVFALLVIDGIYRENEEELGISCGSDGTHMEASLHYVGQAVDCQKPENAAKHPAMLAAIRANLGVDYDVVDEPANGIWHVEFQPKDPLNS